MIPSRGQSIAEIAHAQLMFTYHSRGEQSGGSIHVPDAGSRTGGAASVPVLLGGYKSLLVVLSGSCGPLGDTHHPCHVETKNWNMRIIY